MIFRNRIRSGPLVADISALADGSITPDRRRQVEPQIEASEELRSLLERERAAVGLLRQARERERASESLRRRVEREQLRHSRPARRPRVALNGLAAAAALAGVTAVLLLTGGAATGPSVAQAAGLAARGATAPAPPVSSRDPRALSGGVGEVYFPNWKSTLGWSAVGQRVDRIGGHRAVTVYYRWREQNVAYTIVSVPALDQPHGGLVTTGGLRLRVISSAGRRIVTWRRDGRTCVLSSRNVPAGQLESLAAWS